MKTTTINRRKFLQSLAVAGAAPLILPIRAFGDSGANARINIGAIGCGRQGAGNMRNAMAVADRFNAAIVAVCDVDRNRLRDAANLVKERQGNGDAISQYTDYRELLEREDVDAVIVSTADHSHGMIVLDAVRAGKDVYVEKPLTFGVQEGREVVEAVNRYERIVQVGSQQRSSVYFRRVCELVRSGRLGEVKTMYANLPTDSGTGDPTPMEVPENLEYALWLKPYSDFPYTEDRVHPREGYGRPGFLQVAAHCRGMITGWGTHMVDSLVWGIGMDERTPFTAKGEAEFPDRGLFDVHTTLHAELTFPGGVVMRINCEPGVGAGVRFEGSEGWAQASRGGFEASDRALLLEPDDEDRKLVFSQNHTANWLEAIRSRKALVAPVEAGHLTNTLCVAALAACQAAPGRELEWDPEKEEFRDHPEANAILGLQPKS